MNVDFNAVEFDTSNPEPRCPCILLLDVSGSMSGQPIDELNAGLATFRTDLCQDDLAALRVEVAVITFGGTVNVIQDFVTAGQFVAPTLEISGDTPMGAGINKAMDVLDARKAGYKSGGLAYYRPWIFLITDGGPTDGHLWQTAAQRVQAAEQNKKVAFFTVGVKGADMDILRQINPQRPPVALQGLAFREMFLWLSASMKTVSHAEIGATVPLQAPIGWGSV